MTNFGREERVVLVQYLKEPQNRIDRLSVYIIYIFPSFAFAVYGALKGDFSAVAVAYMALLVMVIVGISYQYRRAVMFRSAVSRCIERIDELERAAGLADEGLSA